MWKTYVVTNVCTLGKNEIDAHFAVATVHIRRYLNMGNSVISPKELVRTLQSNGGFSNTMTSLITHDKAN
jgi:hypothetical protein